MGIENTSKAKKISIIIILGLLSAIGPFSIDMYLPAFNTIAGNFDTTVDQVQLSLSSFFVGIAVGQIIYGPLLDKFGRKKPLYIGLALYIFGSLLCMTSATIQQLIIFRFIQALGSCAGLVASRAMVRDYFTPHEGAKIFSLLMLIIGISPILAPTTGAFVVEHYDWHIIFGILTAIGTLILFSVIFILPESYQGDPTLSLAPARVISNFWAVFKNPDFLQYTLVSSFIAAGLYAFLAGSPFVMQNYFGLSESSYGIAIGAISSALIIATQINRVLLNRIPSAKLARIAIITHFIVAVAFSAAALLNILSLTLLIAFVYLLILAQGFIFPNTTSLPMSPFKGSAGSASSLIGCVQMSVGALASAAVSYFHNETASPMVLVMCTGSFISILSYYIFSKLQSKSISPRQNQLKRID